MDHVDQEVSVVDVLNIFRGLRVFTVNDSPLVHPDIEGLLLPDLECLVINDGRLNDFFVSEHTPGDSVDVIILDILELLSGCVTGLVTDHIVLL